jgi:hypothetical protein
MISIPLVTLVIGFIIGVALTRAFLNWWITR